MAFFWEHFWENFGKLANFNFRPIWKMNVCCGCGYVLTTGSTDQTRCSAKIFNFDVFLPISMKFGFGANLAEKGSLKWLQPGAE